MAQWDDLRREARMLESNLDDNIQQYTQLNRRLTGNEEEDIEEGLESNEEGALATEIENALASLTECKDKMCDCSEAKGVAGERVVQRYREKVFDYKREFNKTMAAIKHKRENAALFAQSKKNDKQSEMDLLMKERNSIHNSQKMANNVLDQAQAAQESLNAQKKTFVAANEKLQQLEAMFPGIGKLIGTIQHKKAKDNVVLSFVIAGCICFLLWMFIL